MQESVQFVLKNNDESFDLWTKLSSTKVRQGNRIIKLTPSVSDDFFFLSL